MLKQDSFTEVIDSLISINCLNFVSGQVSMPGKFSTYMLIAIKPLNLTILLSCSSRRYLSISFNKQERLWKNLDGSILRGPKNRDGGKQKVYCLTCFHKSNNSETATGNLKHWREFFSTISIVTWFPQKKFPLARVLDHDFHFVCHFWELYSSAFEIFIGILPCSQLQ